jgi:hypothetical protein
LKVADKPPTEAYFINYEGLPSDAYLCWTGLGSKMVKGKIPLNTTLPDCSKLTQPTIPTPLTPLSGYVGRNPLNLSWEPALALPLGGEVAHYEILLGNIIYKTPTSACSVTQVTFPSFGNHQWRVRGRTSLDVETRRQVTNLGRVELSGDRRKG